MTGPSELLREAFSPAGAKAVERWFAQAFRGARPRPLMFSGEGAVEIAGGLATYHARRGGDILAAPRSWFVRGGSGPPAALPAAVVVFPQLDDVDQDAVDKIAAGSALLVAGDQLVHVRHGALLLVDLPAERVGDLRLLADAGWPEPSSST